MQLSKHFQLAAAAQALFCFSISLPIFSSEAYGQDSASPTTEVPASSTPKLTDEEKAFQELLNNCVLVGNFTIDGQTSEGGKAERYEIRNVAKLDDIDLWGMTTRITYGDKDATVPIAVPVKFAGKTPMISLDDMFIPGLGTFSARVLFHGNRYAGTWQHGDKGGHMYGYIERIPEDAKEAAKPKE